MDGLSHLNVSDPVSIGFTVLHSYPWYYQLGTTAKWSCDI